MSILDEAFIAAMQRGLPPLPTPRKLEELRPDLLDVIDMDNNAIEPIRDSAIAEEDEGRMPRMDYGTIADVEAALKGGLCHERR
jgi:hypothetical protein